MNKHTSKLSIVAAVALALSLTGAEQASAQSMTATYVTASASSTTPHSASSSQSEIGSTVIWPAIKAQSAIVYNPLRDQVLYAKAPDAARPTASLLKLMTAAVANKLFNLAPTLTDKKITIPAMKDENAADALLKKGSKWTPTDLVNLMLVGSSNKAAETIANGLIPRSSFISLMNFEAKRMGLASTTFRNASGLTIYPAGVDEKIVDAKASSSSAYSLQIAGGISTAQDIAKMFWKVVTENPGLLDATRESTLMLNPTATPTGKGAVTILVNNTNKLLENYPIVFGKTGFTNNAGGNVAVVLQDSATSTPYIIVVMGSTAEDRFADVAALADTLKKVK